MVYKRVVSTVVWSVAVSVLSVYLLALLADSGALLASLRYLLNDDLKVEQRTPINDGFRYANEETLVKTLPLRLFVYPIRDELLYPGSFGNPDGEQVCRQTQDMYFTEHAFYENLINSRYAVTEESILERLRLPPSSTEASSRRLAVARYVKEHPDIAYFFVPHFSTCFYHRCLAELGVRGKLTNIPHRCKELTGRYLQRILNFVQSEYPFYEQSGGGRDHLLVLSWDQAAELFGDENVETKRQLKKMTLLTHLGALNSSSAFNWHKDVVIPPYARYTQMRRTLSSDKLDCAYFRGAIDSASPAPPDGPQYSQGTRKFLASLNSSAIRVYGSALPDQRAYYAELSTCALGLAPPGWSSWTLRFFEVVQAGSVPLLFADDIVLPFEDHLPYRKFVVKVSPRNVSVTAALVEQLLSTNAARSKSLWITKEVKLGLKWHYPVPSQDDAFYLTLRTLAGKRSTRPMGSLQDWR